MEEGKEIIADLHIHSRFSRATSKNLDILNLEKYARIKGVNLLGTGDFQHPYWSKELDALEEKDGLLYTKTAFPFLWQTEVSLIYTQDGKGRRIHYVILAPNKEVAKQVTSFLGSRGRLDYDGRPIFGFSSVELVDEMMKINSDIEIIPAHCLLGDEFIHTNYSIKKIKDIKKGDLVFTHNNQWKKVKEVLIREYNREMYNLIPWYFSEGLSTTPEHPLFAIKSHKNCPSIKGLCKRGCSQEQVCARKYYLNYKKEWIQAKDLEKGDFLVYPRFNQEEDINTIKLTDFVKDYRIINTDFLLAKNSRNNRGIVNNDVQVNKEFCRLVGYFLSEGYLIGEEAIGFSFNSKEKGYIEEVISSIKSLFGFSKYKIDSRRESQADIVFHSKILNSFFNQFYVSHKRRAMNKSIPFWIVLLSKEKLAEVLRGWWRGDTGITVSRELANQMKLICLKLGIIPSISIESAEKFNVRGKHFIKGRKITANNDLISFRNLSFFEDDYGMLKENCFKKFVNKIKRKHGFIDRDYIYLPIRNIKTGEYSGKVYNLEVEDDNSYTCEFACVHNCWTPWFGIFGSMSGFNSLKEAFQEKTDKIHAIETGMSCYDGETEVLTNNGWKKASGVKMDDEICTLNIEKDTIEFQKPVRFFKYRYKGEMYKLRTKRIDLLVTPNHKLLCSHCNFRKKPLFALKEAEFLFNKSKRFKKNGNWIGENRDYFILPKVKIKHGSRFYSGIRNKKEKKFPIKEWLKFFGFWIAEGWTTEGKDGDYGVYLANSNYKLMNKMKKILIGFGYHPYFYKNRGLDTIRLRDYQLFSYLKKFGKSHEKFIPLEIKSLSKELLKIFFDYYIKGDGHRYGRNGKGLSATTISKKLRDDLQEIALKLGMSAYYKLHNKKGTPIVSLPKANLMGYKQSGDSWNIYFIRENIHTVMPSTTKKWGYTESWVDYDGFVYCLEVPNHVVYIRRNGIPVWCGNSDPEMNWRIKELNSKSIVSFSDLHSFWPWRIGREATIFLGELSYKNILKQIRENSFKATVETDPAYGKYHFDGHRLCEFSCSPAESKQLNNLCPKCNKRLVIGVENRVEQLAENPLGFIPKNAKPFYKVLPLHELIALAKASTLASRKTWEVYNHLIEKFGSEFNILLHVEKIDLAKELKDDELLVKLIIDNRIGNIKVKPGYDGEYGIPLLKERQERLF